MEDKTVLMEKIKPLYKEFFRLLDQNATLELRVKEIAVEQTKVKEAEEAKELSQKKSKLLDVMVKNNTIMDSLKVSLKALDPSTPLKESDQFSNLDETGRKSSINGLDIGEDDIETLQRLSIVIGNSGFTMPPFDFSRGPFDVCKCEGCTNLCEATCGHCIGCMGCGGCGACGGACENSCCWSAVAQNS